MQDSLMNPITVTRTHIQSIRKAKALDMLIPKVRAHPRYINLTKPAYQCQSNRNLT